jgi:hypothetical protein
VHQCTGRFLENIPNPNPKNNFPRFLRTASLAKLGPARAVLQRPLPYPIRTAPQTSGATPRIYGSLLLVTNLMTIIEILLNNE